MWINARRLRHVDHSRIIGHTEQQFSRTEN